MKLLRHWTACWGKVQVWRSTTCFATVYPYLLKNPNISMPWQPRMHSRRIVTQCAIDVGACRSVSVSFRYPLQMQRETQLKRLQKIFVVTKLLSGIFMRGIFVWKEELQLQLWLLAPLGWKCRDKGHFLVCRQKNSCAQAIAMKIPTRHKFPQYKLGPRLPTMEFHFHLHYLHWSWISLWAAQKTMGYKRSESWIWIDPVPFCIIWHKLTMPVAKKTTKKKKHCVLQVLHVLLSAVILCNRWVMLIVSNQISSWISVPVAFDFGSFLSTSRIWEFAIHREPLSAVLLSSFLWCYYVAWCTMYLLKSGAIIGLLFS